ncbi:hypothetical protein cyc_04036 [Cyclospora cayetanensis]|uniref:Sm protein B n=1 Tax=Cyclospora cayetanensis TaxID=88456 RepID=A0A1D3D605_9EIME|nr:hypothetical protein cyc_04036 [Cyclospora cayetanensis]
MLVGTFLAFDRHMNVVLADTEEFRKVRTKSKVDGKGVVVEEKELKRTVGLILLRGKPRKTLAQRLNARENGESAGENICTFIAEAPPQQQSKRPDATLAGAGRGIPAGRGVPTVAPLGAAPVGLAGPVRGVGAPAPHQMMGGPPMGRGAMPPPGLQPSMGSVPPMMRPPGPMM